MGTLYIDRKGLHIKQDGNSLAFYANGKKEGIVPITPLKRVVVVGSVTIESSVLSKLAEEGISVVFLSGKRLSFCGMLHGRLHNNGILRLRQYQAALAGFSLVFSRELVKRKVSAQSRLLTEAMQRRPDLRLECTTALRTLEKVLDAISGEEMTRRESLLGLEGGASAAYFAAFTRLFPLSLGFTKRKRRPPEDPVNALLSLCYTMLHFEMVREAEAIGLDPLIGFYHQFEYGRESLACDLVEPHRPKVDELVWTVFREREFTERDFSLDDERPGCYLKKESRKRFYPLYEEWIRSQRPLFIEDVRELSRRLTDGQDAVSE